MDRQRGIYNITKSEPHQIHNHFSSRLSELDMQIVKSVPPGGNWKNIPEHVPSKRIAQIRESYAQGKGSRSTYYGRLLPHKPSYTINTYFNRPGNGCHIHYNQDRVLSQREAARLQSFPDNFKFFGSQTAINNQIGNAVPPLLTFQIAKQVINTIGNPGVFVDLFSGAGGMGLGFKWAGWIPIIANDIESRFLETYAANVHQDVIVGSITDEKNFSILVDIAIKAKEKHKELPFWVLGGPPCQGFSTAGNKRTMKDKRNLLFINYKEFINEVNPDGFVFENVAGLLNMEKGRVFEEVKESFNSVMSSITGWVLNTENFAIPQRRKRVFLVGQNKSSEKIQPPDPITTMNTESNLFNFQKSAITVVDAISDLPSIVPGQDGSLLPYQKPPGNIYQKFMRGIISVEDYLAEFK